MNVGIRLNKNFTTAFNKMLAEYGEDMARLNGFADSQLSYTDFIDNFLAKDTVADSSIDGSANVSQKDIVTLLTEMPKPHMKLLAYHKIYCELNEKYGFKTANAALRALWDGHLYLHDGDTATYKSYCYQYDLKDLAEKGLFFIENFNAEPPKHADTFIDFVKEYISYNCNRTSGQVGLPNLIPYLYYFCNRDKQKGYCGDYKRYCKQQIQRFVYQTNQPFLRNSSQSAFTNVSFFDHEYLTALFGGATFPDGSLMIDEIEGIMEFQKLFLTVMSDIRSQNMFTYPVSTISLLRKNGKFIDEDFARWACEHNRKWCDSNFYIDDSVSSLSNCPLAGDTTLIIKKDGKWVRRNIEDCFNEEREITTLQNGKEIRCVINRFERPANYVITLVNGTKIRTTDNHLNPVYPEGSKETKNLTLDDYLPYGRKAYKGSDELDYNDGFVIGMFIGDGSYNSSSAVVFSLNKDSKADLINYLHTTIAEKFDATTVSDYDCTSQISGKTSCTNVYVGSSKLRSLIERFVLGHGALEKEISSEVLNYSESFRKGILAGWEATDGGNNQRIYTSSKKLVDSMQTMLMSLGMVSTVMEDNRKGRLGTNICYTFRYYQPNSKKGRQKDVYIKTPDCQYMKIKSIEQIETDEPYSYCLQVLDGDKPLFTLANGIITHNCRLRSDISELYFNSIGGTALSVGSVKVSTINLARLALENKTENEYLLALKEMSELNLKILDVVRHIIKRNVEKGLLKNFSYGLVDFAHLYNTQGVIGVYETLKTFGYTREDEFNHVYYTKEAEEFGKKIFDTIHAVANAFKIGKDYMINCEAVPQETAAAKLMKKDEFFYPDTVVKDLPLYGNQFLPLGIKATLAERTRVAAMFDSFCNGGSIEHINLAAPFSTKGKAWDMLNWVADQGVTYFAFNPRIQACAKNHGYYGKICPVCGGKTVTEYTRIVGFFVSVRTYSEERKKEYALRQWEGEEK